jgi:hypothetical protein
MASRFGAGGAFRIFAIVYVVQATLGIAAGVAYAVWLLYW